MSDWSFYDRGFSLFPIAPRTKHPAVEWERYQTQRATPEQVAFWATNTALNTGVATGAVSGVVVLDFDGLAPRAMAEALGLPETLVIATPRGWHFYFAHPGWDVPNKAGRGWTKDIDGVGFDGMDLRGDGGFVVGPGSYFNPTDVERAKGKVEGRYAVETDAPIAPAPDWLLQLIFPKVRKPQAPLNLSDTTTDYGRAALNKEIAILTATEQGGVNQQVNNSAFAIGQLVAGGEIATAEGWGALIEALHVLQIGDEEKALGTLERGWAAGMEAPRAVEHYEPVTPEQALGRRETPTGQLVAPPVEGAMIAPAPPPNLTRTFLPVRKPQFVGGGEVWDYFEGCVYIVRRDEMFIPTGQMIGKSSFDGIYGGPQFVLDYDGSKKVRSAWEMFRQNSQVDLPKAWDVCFRPELPAGQIVSIEGLPYLNIYVPIVTPRAAGDASPFINHVRKLLPHGRDADYLLHWMASCVQNPGKKFHWWPVVQGTKGNGKSMLINVMTAALGERYSHNVKADSVIKTGNQFNDWIVGKLFLGFHEIRSSEGRRDFVEIMKDSVTEKRLSTEGKGLGQGTSDNRANGLMCTNWKDACPVDDDERRWGIFYCAQQSMDDLDRDGMGGDYFPRLYDWLNNGGHAIVTNFLATMPLQAAMDPARDLHRAPFTTSTQEAITESRGVLEQEIQDAIESEAMGFRGGVVTSQALRNLFDRMRKTIGPKRYRSIMASVGFVTHPLLEANRGRPNNPLFDGTRPVIYYCKDHEILQMGVYADVIAQTEAILQGGREPVSNVVPFRR